MQIGPHSPVALRCERCRALRLLPPLPPLILSPSFLPLRTLWRLLLFRRHLGYLSARPPQFYAKQPAMFQLPSSRLPLKKASHPLSSSSCFSPLRFTSSFRNGKTEWQPLHRKASLQQQVQFPL